MDLKNIKNRKNIKIAFIAIIIILSIEIIFAGTLFIIKKKNQNKINNANLIINDNPTKPITEIEKEAIIQKNVEKLKTTAEKDTNPRTRPLPKF